MKKNKLLKHKESLAIKFVGLLITFLFLFIFVIVISYNRLTDYKDLFNDITSKSIPKIVNSSNINNHTNELIFLAEKLNNSKTPVLRRITFKKIEEKIDLLQNLGKKLTKENDYLINSLDIIKIELFNLNKYIEKGLILQDKIEKQNNNLFNLNKKILSNKSEASFIKIVDTWKMTYSEIVNLAYNSLSINRFNPLKENIKKINLLNNKLKKNTNQLQNPLKEIFLIYFKDLQNIIFNKNGLLKLKTQQLKINNKAVGKENFVNNLIKEFSNQIEYSSYTFLDDFTKKTKENSKKVNEQINYMNILFLFVLLYLVFLIYYINKRIVSRLVNLNTYVKEKLLGNNRTFKDDYNDEISQIKKTFNYYAKKVDNQKKLLEELSITDSLTNIPNRRAFDLEFERNIQLVKRSNLPFSLLLMDIDFFKSYNDNYGHTKGDMCLSKVSKVLKKTIKRELDFVARYGGEEFVCILSNCNKNEAKKMAYEILQNLKEANIPHNFSKVSKNITLSIGITSITSKNIKEKDLLINEADKALYHAKEKGRNCIIHFEDMDKI